MTTSGALAVMRSLASSQMCVDPLCTHHLEWSPASLSVLSATSALSPAQVLLGVGGACERDW